MDYYLIDFINNENKIYIGNFNDDISFWSYFNLNIDKIKQQEYDMSNHYLWLMSKIENNGRNII